MSDPVDPRFKQQKKSAQRRRRKAGAARYGLLLGVPLVMLVGVGGLVFATWGKWSFGPAGDQTVAEEELAVDLVALEQEAAAASAAFAAAFIDIPGDPMVIRLSEADTSETVKQLAAPKGLDPVRVSTGLVLVSDVMVSAEERFITTLPSSQEDFAFFQAQRRTSRPTGGVTPQREDVVPETSDQGQGVPDATGAGDADSATSDDSGDDNAGWGTALDNTTEALPEFAETRVQDTTSVFLVAPEQQRQLLTKDVFVRISAERDLAGLLVDKGFNEANARAVEEAARDILGLENLQVGQVVAMRGQPQPDGSQLLVQLSLYDNDVYFGTLARTDDGEIGEGSDPWVDEELFDYAEGDEAEVSQEQRYRMMDAFYSTAIRNRVPSIVVGEAIALLSKAYDLDSFANPGDRMSMLYSQEQLEEDTGTGQLLYLALKGESVDVECFVFRSGPGQDYACYGAKPGKGASGDGSGGLVGGMVTPVKGVLTSRFGPRTHPVLKTVRIHKGVDWAAPIGTPIEAAFDGTISYAGDGRGYGNLVKISHANGFETRYAHMDRFNTKSGAKVRAGDVVGYVGTTGLSTGPHLHFELYLDGTAIDPFGAGAGTASASDAVEILTNQIIRVESAGNANAKNPLSTATGLGQFIESTWLRMMRTYRPDLASSLSKQELLALRTEPTISREMVKNLAREGESYLRARGHNITAGRLYLCHFLGAVGADKVLKSSDNAMLIDVLGAGVIKANPFLKGKTVAYVEEWAERKMRGRGKVASAPAPIVREPAGLVEYRKEIKTLLQLG